MMKWPNFFWDNKGVLGINARNLLYIRPFNRKRAIRLADSKLQTKHFLSARGVPVPKLYSVIRNQNELSVFDFSTLPSSFVLKPNMGFGGEGIIPIIARKGDYFEKASGTLISIDELKEHIGDILEGRFSLSGMVDTAFFEQRVVCDDVLAKFSYKGLPDIRIVVHNLIPVMAMLRLPTRESDGRANIHQGALGVGIDIAKGIATHVSYKGKVIDAVPEFGAIKGLKIPYWDEMLLTASRVQLMTNLGYMAVDMVLDKKTGPILLEINARAGLGVQIANLSPLRKRLERIRGVKVNSPEKGVRIAQDMFGTKVERSNGEIGGKKIIGSEEKVKILRDKEARIIWASINPLLEVSVIDNSLASFLSAGKSPDISPVKVKFSLSGVRVQTLAEVDDLSGKHFDMIVGRRDLQNFLIDPSKASVIPSKIPALASDSLHIVKHLDYHEVDAGLVEIDKHIMLLSYLAPLDISNLRRTFIENPDIAPVFQYKPLNFEAFELRKGLHSIQESLDDSPLGNLFSLKAQEISKKIDLLEARSSDFFTDCSVNLYGGPNEYLKKEADMMLSSMPSEFNNFSEKLSTDESIFEFQESLMSYGLSHWIVKIKKNMVSSCLAGKNNALFVREGAKFSSHRLRMLIAHEIETHILSAENGKMQGFQLFNRGFADYLQTQEGLAVWNQDRVLAHSVPQKYRNPLLIFLVDFAMKNGFVETYDYCLKLKMGPKKAFMTTLRLKRGVGDASKPGAFTKDSLYFSGYLQIRDFVVAGGDLKKLYYGKFNLRDLPLIESLPFIKHPKYIPHFLL